VLAKELDVTAQTIRRDLTELCNAGLMARVHGGAILITGRAYLDYDARKVLAPQEKTDIGKACAAMIPENASVFLGLGTTAVAVARALTHHKDLMVVTNNLRVADVLSKNVECEVIVAGGVLRRSDGGLMGDATVEFVRQFKVDYAVIGAAALDNEGWLLDHDFREVRVLKALIENARQTFLVADGSKLSQIAPIRVAHLSDIDAFVTNTVPCITLAEMCAGNGVMVTVVPDADPSVMD